MFVIMIVNLSRKPGRIISFYGGIGLLALAFVFSFGFFNIRSTSTVKTEQLGTSVRENPSSYRPVLIYYTGYHRRYSSGGYSGGK